jgi:DNA polymerase III epsilon subunit-like protein
VHGITTERALRDGRPLAEVLTQFTEAVAAAESLVAHNIGFDEKIIGAEFYRSDMPNLLESKHKICTMEGSKAYCALPGPYGYKWPKLSELHVKLFDEGFAEAHNARADIEATAKCFWELRKRGVV